LTNLSPRALVNENHAVKFPIRSFHPSIVVFGEKVPFKLSDIGEGITEVTVKEWYIKIPYSFLFVEDNFLNHLVIFIPGTSKKVIK